MEDIVTEDRVELFNQWASTYERSIRGPRGFPFEGYSDVQATIVDLSHVTASMSVLDLGTGTGNLASLFAELGCNVYGVDFSESMLQQARTKVPTATFMLADLRTEFPSPAEGRFDRVVSAYVLHEFDPAARVAMLEGLFLKYLQPSGLLVIGDISFPSVRVRDGAKLRWKEKWDDAEYYWAEDETRELLTGKNMRVKYTQVSSCAGVYVFQLKTEDQGPPG